MDEVTDHILLFSINQPASECEPCGELRALQHVLQYSHYEHWLAWGVPLRNAICGAI